MLFHYLSLSNTISNLQGKESLFYDCWTAHCVNSSQRKKKRELLTEEATQMENNKTKVEQKSNSEERSVDRARSWKISKLIVS